MQKAAEDLRNEAKKKAEEKEQYINERVPILKTEGMNQGVYLLYMKYHSGTRSIWGSETCL